MVIVGGGARCQAGEVANWKAVQCNNANARAARQKEGVAEMSLREEFDNAQGWLKMGYSVRIQALPTKCEWLNKLG